LIQVEHLTKTYNGRVNAVDDLSFTIDKGQIYGFLGPNGAGKSTTMNIITGYISATSGSVTVNGYDVFQNPKAAKRCIGYLPEQPPLYTELTPREYLKIAAGLKGVPKAERKAQIEEIMELTGISGVADRLIRHLSKGYKQRVGLAQAMIGYPEVLILDEPTVGLDPKQIIEMRDLIRSLRDRHTVILSSHILSEVSAVCDTVMIISKGKLVASDTPENLSRRMEEQSVLLLTVRGEQARVAAALDVFKDRAEINYAASEHEENATDVYVESAENTDLREEIFFRLADARLPLLSMNRSEMTLEDVFLELTEDTYSDSSSAAADADAEEYEIEFEDDEETEEEGEEEEEC